KTRLKPLSDRHVTYVIHKPRLLGRKRSAVQRNRLSSRVVSQVEVHRATVVVAAPAWLLALACLVVLRSEGTVRNKLVACRSSGHTRLGSKCEEARHGLRLHLFDLTLDAGFVAPHSRMEPEAFI